MFWYDVTEWKNGGETGVAVVVLKGKIIKVGSADVQIFYFM